MSEAYMVVLETQDANIWRRDRLAKITGRARQEKNWSALINFLSNMGAGRLGMKAGER